MRAIVIEGPDRVVTAEIPVPACGDDEVSIEVVAGGICGTDVEILHGDMVYYASGAAAYPVIPCHEWVGIVREVGRNVTHVAPGDHVVGEVSIGCLSCPTCLSGHYHRCPRRTETGVMNRLGGFAERTVLPGAFVHRIASTVPLRAAALVEPTAVAFNGVLKAGLTPGADVAIFGDGPIGLLILQIVRLFEARRVVLVGASDTRLALAHALGADRVIDARTGEVAAPLAMAFDRGAPAVIFEASGNPEAIRMAIATAGAGGQVVLQGFCGGRRVEALDTDTLIVNDLTVHGALGSPGIWPQVIDLIERGRLDPGALVTHELPVSAFADAIRLVETREACKVVLRTDVDGAWT